MSFDFKMWKEIYESWLVQGEEMSTKGVCHPARLSYTDANSAPGAHWVSNLLTQEGCGYRLSLFHINI